MPHPPSDAPAARPPVGFGEALRVWLRVAALSFGGPAGQIAVMHRILVQEKRWIGESRFLHALNYCMLLPGPEAQQLATYVGWLLHRWVGGLTAGLLFILPGFVSILALSVLYARYLELTLVAALFFGLKPAVMAVVVEALLRIGRRALHGRLHLLAAAAAFIGIFLFEVPFPLIVVAAAAFGLAVDRLWPGILGGGGGSTAAAEAGGDPVHDESEVAVRPSARRAITVAALWAAVWLGPLLAVRAWLGSEHVLWREGIFFSTAAVVTFGGAYAVLAYVAQQAVEAYGWLLPGEMLDGLGMAETTPGPLIQVVQFVGFMGAYRHPGGLDPLVAGVLGSIVTTWVTFAPCFLWIFVGAPYIEYLRGNRALGAALSTITAAVVGVVLNLAVWFSIHTLFGTVDEVRWAGMRLLVPEWSTVEPVAVLIAAGAAVALLRFRLGMISVLAGSVLVGLLLRPWA